MPRQLSHGLLAAALAILSAGVTTAASPRVPAAIVYLIRGDAVDEVIASLASLDRFFNDRFRYPVVIFHATDAAPLAPADAARLARGTRSALIFVPVALMVGGLNATALRAAPPTAHGFPKFTLAYRAMCRFFAGPFAREPALAAFRYAWRMDSDTRLLLPVTRDVFADAARMEVRYAHGVTQCDWHLCTTGLYDIAAAHFGATSLAQRLHPAFSDASCLREPGGSAGGYNNRIYVSPLASRPAHQPPSYPAPAPPPPPTFFSVQQL